LLWAVTALSLSETYHLPPIGLSGAKAIVSTHDDTIEDPLSAALFMFFKRRLTG
jgi:hypothetical protein